MKRVEKVIKCDTTLQLIRRSLSAGHIDPKTGERMTPEVGTPQGSILSPLLCNIVLHTVDKGIENKIREFRMGDKRRPNPEYVKLNSSRRYIRDLKGRKAILKKMRTLSTVDTMDPNFKRAIYVRYADDFVIMMTGHKKEAVKLREWVAYMLKTECGLTLNMEKTVISNTVTDSFQFLGADCRRARMTRNHVIKHGTRTIRATTRLRVNADLSKIYRKLIANGLAVRDHNNIQIPRGTAKNNLINLSHHEIISFYNNKINGLLSYYSFAGNRSRLGGAL